MFEATRRYLAEIPVLAALVDAAYAMNPVTSSNPDELRTHLITIQKQVVQALNQVKSLYRVELYPNESFTCPACGWEAKGAYWELSNPTTSKRELFPSSLLHGFIDHGTMSLDEPVVNLSNIYTGDRELKLSLEALMRVFTGLDLPEPVVAELTGYFEHPEAFPAAKLTAGRAS